VQHREEEYSEDGFDVLAAMQSEHFWYKGRHRFILAAMERLLASTRTGTESLAAIDLGGGCGGWVRYLTDRSTLRFSELALGDSSMRALDLAQSVIGPKAERYQVDLLNLQWENRWDIISMLDVLEHIPDDVTSMRQVAKALRPGGIAIIATPAFPIFWTYNDDYAKHQRRYVKADFRRLAASVGLELIYTRYFMFFLSPLLVASRMIQRPGKDVAPADVDALVKKAHRVPAAPVNAALSAILAAETTLGHYLPFPWGTSVVGVFQRRAASQSS
jgi:SAM-dependent methyltransferase